MKRLEFHLSTIEELYDSYDLHRKLREGVRNMAQVRAWCMFRACTMCIHVRMDLRASVIPHICGHTHAHSHVFNCMPRGMVWGVACGVWHGLVCGVVWGLHGLAMGIEQHDIWHVLNDTYKTYTWHYYTQPIEKCCADGWHDLTEKFKRRFCKSCDLVTILIISFISHNLISPSQSHLEDGWVYEEPPFLLNQ